MYNYYLAQNNAMNILIVENNDTWQVAILDWDFPQNMIKQIISDADLDSLIWYKDITTAAGDDVFDITKIWGE